VVGQHVRGFIDFLFLNFSCSQIWLNSLVTRLSLLKQHEQFFKLEIKIKLD